MSEKTLRILTILLFLLLVVVYYSVPFRVEFDRTFLTVSTFLFSIFTGFFIARQGTRYSNVRKEIGAFDGDMSFIYRASGHLGHDLQNKVGTIIKEHYQIMLERHDWDYHFTHKSTTLTSIHESLDEHVGDTELHNLKNNALNRIIAALLNAQQTRKQMVALYQERIPKFQWMLIYLFVIILLATASIIPSVGVVLAAVLKAAFVVSILAVLLVLHKLDDLSFFEIEIGEQAGRDVVEIIEGNK